MKPIEKGTIPRTPQRNLPMNFNDWTKAIPFLKKRTGSYCHFCEMRVTNSIAIEHIKPKIHFPKLANHWDNFLLICTYCNSHKLETIPLSPYRKHYFWAHIHNTLLAFQFGGTNLSIIANSNLNNLQTQKANQTIKLYGLDKIQNSKGEQDERHLNRLQTIKIAIDSLLEYNQNLITIPTILNLAKTTGFFMVWFQIFENITEVKKALVECADFRLNRNFFDANYNPIPRINQDEL